MIALGALASMLGLSLLSDVVTRHIKRHAIHVGEFGYMELPKKWITWGTRVTGEHFARPTGRKNQWGDEEVEHVPHIERWLMFRVPGWYIESIADIRNDRPAELKWCRRYFYWRSGWLFAQDEWKRRGWREHFIPEDRFS